VRPIFEDGKASDDLLNDYGSGDSYHHESHVDKPYNFEEAAQLIGELSDYEETDTGLWQGMGMKEAVCACAAYTYGAAVYAMWRELIEDINDNLFSDCDLDAIDAKYLRMAKDKLALTRCVELTKLVYITDIADDDDDLEIDEDARDAEKKSVIRAYVKERCTGFTS
jgi:hypothetical protein